ncbi:MAG: thioredoxin domain-containing protein [Anaerolineae bacterium]
MKEKLVRFIKEDGLTVLIVVLIVAVYAYLRTPGDEFASLSEFDARLTAGQPTIVEFYANNCSICLLNKPKVDQLERDLAGQATVVRLNVKDNVGLALASRWGVAGIPAFFVLDGAGNVIYARAGAPNIEALKAAAATAQP